MVWCFLVKIGGIFYERSIFYSYCGRVEGIGMVYYLVCIEILLFLLLYNLFYFENRNGFVFFYGDSYVILKVYDLVKEMEMWVK